MNTVQAARLAGDVNRLVGFGTRHALSDGAKANRGIGAAREGLLSELRVLDGRFDQTVVAGYDEFDLTFGGRTTRQKNVIATLPGIGFDKRLIYVTAHYDSRGQDINDAATDAPGADDDASGTSVLLELAKVLVARRWDATVRLAAFAAQEEGLAGSKHHAAAAKQMGLPIDAVFNNDVVGRSRGQGEAQEEVANGSVRAFSAGPEGSASRGLARYAAVIATRYGPLAVQVLPPASRSGHEGDHQSFSTAGIPALGLTEPFDDTGRLHTSRDTTDKLDFDYLAKVTRLNVALVGNLALAPPAPAAAPLLVAVAGASDRLRVRWAPVDDPRVAGYFVAWRAGGEATYREERWAGTGTELELTSLPADQSLRVAIASSDDRGHTSLFGPEAVR